MSSFDVCFNFPFPSNSRAILSFLFFFIGKNRRGYLSVKGKSPFDMFG